MSMFGKRIALFLFLDCTKLGVERLQVAPANFTARRVTARPVNTAGPPSTTSRMGRGGNLGHLTLAAPRHKTQEVHLDSEPLFIRFLRTFRDILKFVLFSYTVLFGSLLLARWTTYYMVGK